MVALRKAGAYSKMYARPYTRVSKKKNKNFIKTNPQKKIVKFTMGNVKIIQDKKFDTVLRVKNDEKITIQVRDSAIESARQSVIRNLEAKIPGQFYFEIKISPHHILRENKMLTGAGSDRMQTGMQKSFGKTIGRAALVRPGHDIFVITTSGDKNTRIIRENLSSIKAKFPCKIKISTEKIVR